MRKQLAIISGLVSLGLVTSACSTARQALGLEKVAPDEFRVVTKAPLSVPPDYALRPPAPGGDQPQTFDAQSSARMVLIGKEAAARRTQGENLLVAKAGGDRVDPSVRFVVDDENGDLTYKTPDFANRVINFRPDDERTPLNAMSEAERLRQQAITSATGGQPVIIRREEPGSFKLPGL